MKKMKITSIDIGIQHFALTLCELTQDTMQIELKEAKLIDIQDFECERSKCTLHHDRCFADWMAHVFVKYSHFFKSDKILVERQPPCGLVAIEQLIYSYYRDRTILISPRSVHAHFKCNFDGDKQQKYEARKKKMCEITKHIRGRWAATNTEWKSWDREHDVADALAQTMYYTSKLREEARRKKRREEAKNTPFAKTLAQYSYKGSLERIPSVVIEFDS